MRYIFYHIFKRLGWTSRKPIMFILVDNFEPSQEQKDAISSKIKSRFSKEYEIIISFEDVENTEIKIIY